LGSGRTGGCVRHGIESGSERWDGSLSRQLAGPEPIPTQHFDEYGAPTILAAGAGSPIRMDCKVADNGLLTKLLRGVCVVVPGLVDGTGVRLSALGELSTELPALNRHAIGRQELSDLRSLASERDAICQALALDPLGAAVCSLDGIWSLLGEMFVANEPWLPDLCSEPRSWERLCLAKAWVMR